MSEDLTEKLKDSIALAEAKKNGGESSLSTIRLGSLGMEQKDVISCATKIATELAKIVNKRKLFTVIGGKKSKPKKFVWVEGWTTMGAMLGISPLEEYTRPLPDGRGYESRIVLKRLTDGMIVGAASAECTVDEANWKGRETYAIRSMAETRATGKAFRLSYAWIMKLAGFEGLPAEEMEQQQWEEAREKQQEVATEKVATIRGQMAAKIGEIEGVIKSVQTGRHSLKDSYLVVTLVVYDAETHEETDAALFCYESGKKYWEALSGAKGQMAKLVIERTPTAAIIIRPLYIADALYDAKGQRVA